MADATSPTAAAAAAAPATPASASSASAAGEPKLKMPIQIAIPNTEEKSSMGGLKSYTAYCITINDFGRQFTIEKRYDDFQKLHSDISQIDRNLPPMPEKKMFASTDESVVAERRPAFEKMLRYMLRSEEIACEKENTVWKFLELPLPATVAARYLFKSRRLALVKQVGKLLDDKYFADHAYRLCHDSVLKTNLFLLTEGNLADKPKTAAAAEPASETAGADGYPATKAPVAKAGNSYASDLEIAIIEMIGHAIKEKEARKTFLEEDGLATIWRLQLRIAQSGTCSAPDDSIRKVLSTFIHVEGDRYAEVFAGFLKNGGVEILAGFKEPCQQHGSFAEFIGKALWIAWEVDTQRAFLEGDDSGGSTGLGILGAIFGCSTKLSQILAGLLLSSIIANDLFASNRERESQAAAGINGVVEDLLVAMPTFIDPRKSGGDKGTGGAGEEAAEAFIAAALGKNEKAFARVLTCVGAPCLRNPEGVEHTDSAVWSAGAFGLWCLLKTKPKPARVASLRPSIPLLAQYGPPRVRWLTGELLLMLHVEETKDPEAEGAGIGAEASGLEQNAVEAAMSEQINSTLQNLQENHQQNRSLMDQQQQLFNVHQQSHGDCFADLQKALASLTAAREKIAKTAGSTESAEAQCASSLQTLHTTLSAGDANANPELQRSLDNVQNIETTYNGKKNELQQLEESLKWQSGTSDQSRIEMEEADGAVSATRKRIAEMEQELSTKQREAQQQRILATSDQSSRRVTLTSDTEEIDAKLGKLREKAQKMQAGEPLEPGGAPPEPAKVQEVMGQLKQQASQLKQRRAEIQAELSKANIDPAAAQDNAERLEQEAANLHDQLNFVRSSELQELERSHVARREVWQQETGRLQEIRSLRDSAEFECSGLKRQLDERWRVWRPLWSSRLNCWHERASALGEAQVSHHRFTESVNGTWEVFREEEARRQDVLQAVANVQDSLSALSQQLGGIR